MSGVIISIMTGNQIEEVKSKIDIVSLISEYIEVKKAGRNYKANCPFHGEKTASFMISSELQMYKCFGCGKHGDCFTFLEEHEGMEFNEALKYLAEKTGVTLTLIKQSEASVKDKIIEINRKAVNFYNYALLEHQQGKKILDYLLNQRGLSLELIKLFKIGYSPESYDALSKYLIIKNGYKLQDLIKSGNLVGKGIDRFRGRVIFPLFDHRDDCVGFAGRILPWQNQDTAKYINSPDTDAYHKSKILYGLNISKNEIRNNKFAVIVEGELDMISSFQAGVRNTVAIKGSALTEDQIRLIGRFAQRIVLCLDSDSAGNEATKRGSILAVDLGFEVKVALIEGFKDPDDAARNNPEAYKKSIEDAIDIWEFLINQVFMKYDLSNGEGRSHISKEIFPLLNLIKEKIVQSFYVEKVARKLSVPTDLIQKEILQKNDSLSNISSLLINEDVNKNRRLMLEEKLLANAASKDIGMLFNEDVFALINSDFIRKVIVSFKQGNDKLPEELRQKYGEIVLANSEDEDLQLIIKELKRLDTKQKLEALNIKIKNDENNENLLKEFNELTKKLSETLN